MKPGRNDPCPCGSGKKYKQCCLRADSGTVETPEDFLRRRIRTAIEGLVPELLKFTYSQLDARLVDEAWTEFTGEERAFEPENPHLPVFMPWFFYQWTPDPEGTEFPDLAARSATVAGDFLARRRRHLDPLLVRYVEACAASAFSFHEVMEVEAGRGFTLRDVVLEHELFVVDHSASRGVGPGDIVFAQVVIVDGLALLESCATMVFRPGDKPAIIELRKRIRAKGDSSDAALLKAWDIELIDLYLELAERVLAPRLPELQNTDGEPLEPSTLVFRVADVEAAVAAVDSARLPSDESIAQDDVRRDAAGGLIEATWTWQRAGNAIHKSWSNTSLGHLSLKGNTLKLLVNSAARAARGRTMVERVLGANATYRARRVDSVDKMIEEAKQHPSPREGSEHERLMQVPEVRRQLQEMLMRHYTDWLTTAVPALGGLTPREAVRDRDGREAVAAMVAQLERDGTRQSPPLDPAVPAMLRRELGLT